jgi:His/Glu/Gln/Arg/opine family amino acid ABC transporter permease subunit
MLDSWLKSIYVLIKNWHFSIAEALCTPIMAWLPQSITPHCNRFIDGFLTTFELVILVLLGAFLCARLLSCILILGPHWAKRLLNAYVYCFRGTPVLIQLWLVYYGLAQFVWVRESELWLFLSSGWWVGLIVLTLNSAAYQTNILFSAIENLEPGQSEGASSLGLSPYLTYHKILLPQALRVSWPALANEAILILKASALVSTITVLDLMGHARTIFSRSYDLWVYGGAAVLYIALTAIITLLAYSIRRIVFKALPADEWFKNLTKKN